MKDRIPRYPGRVKVTPEGGGTPFFATLERADEPEQVGTDLSKELFDHVFAAIGTTGGSSTAYTLAGDGGFVLTDGATIRFRLHIDSGATPTIDVNGTGAKRIVDSGQKPLRVNTPAGVWLVATYCAELDFFVLQGSRTETARYGNGIGQITDYELMLCGFSPDYSRNYYSN